MTPEEIPWQRFGGRDPCGPSIEAEERREEARDRASCDKFEWERENEDDPCG